MTVAVIVLSVVAVGLGVAVFVLATQLRDLKLQLVGYESITNIEKHVEEQKGIAETKRSEAQSLAQKIDTAKKQYLKYTEVLGKFQSIGCRHSPRKHVN